MRGRGGWAGSEPSCRCAPWWLLETDSCRPLLLVPRARSLEICRSRALPSSRVYDNRFSHLFHDCSCDLIIYIYIYIYMHYVWMLGILTTSLHTHGWTGYEVSMNNGRFPKEVFCEESSESFGELREIVDLSWRNLGKFYLGC